MSKIVAIIVLILTFTLAAIAGETFGLPGAFIAVPILALPGVWAFHELGVGR